MSPTPPNRTRVATLTSGELEYRLQQSDEVPAIDRTLLVCHGGHLRASISLGEERFLSAGWSVLAPSRPGYGRTPLTAQHEDAFYFADQVAELCSHLNIPRVVVLGMSAGSSAALALTSRHPHLVERLVLASGLSSLPWPDPVTRLASSMTFHPWAQAGTWAWLRATVSLTPGFGLRLLLGSTSTLPPERVIADLTDAERARAVDLFLKMDSGAGFMTDLTHRHDEALQRSIRRPTLIVASGTDGAVPFRHALHLHETIPGSQLWRSPSLSHVLWLGTGAAETEDQIFSFADTGELVASWSRAAAD